MPQITWVTDNRRSKPGGPGRYCYTVHHRDQQQLLPVGATLDESCLPGLIALAEVSGAAKIQVTKLFIPACI
jgi:hypothetical protein